MNCLWAGTGSSTPPFVNVTRMVSKVGSQGWAGQREEEKCELCPSTKAKWQCLFLQSKAPPGSATQGHLAK